ncbi:MAG: diguanylate cyclase [Acidobacteriota bacterium]|nr:diguanylate cyclase [Acidobacteriota bacterium]
MRIFVIAILACMLATADIPAVGASAPAERPLPQEKGDPLLRNFLPRDYGAFFQNWCVVQDRRGLIYVGNNSGILEYDSVRWRLIRTERGTMVRSMALDGNGRIYVGAQGEFGYLAPNAMGKMDYVSLMDRIRPEDRKISDIWSICFLENRVYFQAFERLFCLQGDKVQVWRPSQVFQSAFAVRGRLYVQDSQKGLMVLNDTHLELVPGGEFFAREKIGAILPWDLSEGETHGLLICTKGQGLFLYDGGMVKPFPTQADAALRQGQLYHAIPLADGTLGIATLQSGFMRLARDGSWLDWVGKREGLPIESVKHLFQDSQLGTWMALGKGISRMGIDSPVSIYNEKRGLPGTVFAIHRHGGTLYAGTDQGLFRLDLAGTNRPFFSPIAGLSGAVWSFVSWEDRLLVANYSGLYEIQGGKANLIRKSVTGNYFLLRSRKDPRRLFIGLSNGLASCRLEGGRWLDEGMVLDLPMQVRTIDEADDGSLWLGTYAQGVMHVSFPSGIRREPPQVERFGTEKGLPSLNYTYLYRLSSGLKATSKSGIYRFREDIRRFEPDPAFANFYPGGSRWIYNLVEDRQGRVWMHSCDEAQGINESGVAVPRGDGSYRWDVRPCVRFNGDWVNAILAEADGVVWFGTSEGIVRLAPTSARPQAQAISAMIRSVNTMGGKLLFGGTPSGSAAGPKIPFFKNQLRFEFAVPSYDLENANRYQIFLEGNDADWSAWTAEPFKEYSNLAAGWYRFRVRAQDVYGSTGAEDSFAFRILPPWYRTWWAYVLWVLSGAAALVGVVSLYTQKLRRQKAHLEKIVAERTQQLRDASLTDPLTGLRNRRFIMEVLKSDITAYISFRKHVLKASDSRDHSVENKVFGLFVLDIDFFKKVNDTYGHDAGDRVLKQFASILTSSVRTDDVVLRTGGEEFLVVLKKTRPEYLPVFASKVLSRVASAPFDLGDGTILRKTCSIGFVSFPIYPKQPDLLSFEQSMMAADLGMYVAKKQGRNQGVCLAEGRHAPDNEENLQKAVTSLDFAFEEGYLQVGSSVLGPKTMDK